MNLEEQTERVRKLLGSDFKVSRVWYWNKEERIVLSICKALNGKQKYVDCYYNEEEANLSDHDLKERILKPAKEAINKSFEDEAANRQN